MFLGRQSSASIALRSRVISLLASISDQILRLQSAQLHAHQRACGANLRSNLLIIVWEREDNALPVRTPSRLAKSNKKRGQTMLPRLLILHVALERDDMALHLEFERNTSAATCPLLAIQKLGTRLIQQRSIR